MTCMMLHCRWTCWNTLFMISAVHAHNYLPLPDNCRCSNQLKLEGGEIVLDAPLIYHTPKLIYWCVVKALTLKSHCKSRLFQLAASGVQIIVATDNTVCLLC